MYPVLFKIGVFQIHTFGVMMVLGFTSAIYVAGLRAEKSGLTKMLMSDCCFWALLAGVLGARIAFIVQEPIWFIQHPSELFSLQFRGLTSFGGLIFGGIAVLIWSKKHSLSAWSVLDLASPAFIIGHAIGRIGCLMNGCCFGKVCPPGLPWAIRIVDAPGFHHPAQAYDTVMNLGLFAILLWRERKGLPPGQLTGLMLALHGFTRIIYEFWRAGTPQQVEEGIASSTYWGAMPFTQAQAMAGLIVIVGLAVMVVTSKKRPRLAPGKYAAASRP